MIFPLHFFFALSYSFCWRYSLNSTLGFFFGFFFLVFFSLPRIMLHNICCVRTSHSLSRLYVVAELVKLYGISTLDPCCVLFNLKFYNKNEISILFSGSDVLLPCCQCQFFFQSQTFSSFILNPLTCVISAPSIIIIYNNLLISCTRHQSPHPTHRLWGKQSSTPSPSHPEMTAQKKFSVFVINSKLVERKRANEKRKKKV